MNWSIILERLRLHKFHFIIITVDSGNKIYVVRAMYQMSSIDML